MSNYKQWAAANLRVGGYPNPCDLDPNGKLADVDVFINVSDDWQGGYYSQIRANNARPFWFPMGEQRGTMPLASIYGAMQILWAAEHGDHNTYLHCAAGINRSQTVADCYHYIREEGLSHRPAHTVRAKVRGLAFNALENNCHFGVLPSLSEMEAWLLRVAEQLGDANGGGFDYSKPPVFI